MDLGPLETRKAGQNTIRALRKYFYITNENLISLIKKLNITNKNLNQLNSGFLKMNSNTVQLEDTIKKSGEITQTYNKRIQALTYLLVVVGLLQLILFLLKVI